MTVLRNRGRWGPSNAVYARGRVRAYDKRTPPPGAEWIDYGLLGLTPAALAATRRTSPTSWRPRARAGQLAGLPVRARFYEIGTPEALAETGRFLSRRAVTRRSCTRSISGPAVAGGGGGAGAGVEGHRRRRGRRQHEVDPGRDERVGGQRAAARRAPARTGSGSAGARGWRRPSPGAPARAVAPRLLTTSSTGPEVQAKTPEASCSGGYQPCRRS